METRPNDRGRLLEIDKDLYLVDDDKRTYVYLSHNPDWEKLDPARNEANKHSIAGYERILRDGHRKAYDGEHHP